MTPSPNPTGSRSRPSILMMHFSTRFPVRSPPLNFQHPRWFRPWNQHPSREARVDRMLPFLSDTSVRLWIIFSIILRHWLLITQSTRTSFLPTSAAISSQPTGIMNYFQDRTRSFFSGTRFEHTKAIPQPSFPKKKQDQRWSCFFASASGLTSLTWDNELLNHHDLTPDTSLQQTGIHPVRLISYRSPHFS